MGFHIPWCKHGREPLSPLQRRTDLTQHSEFRPESLDLQQTILNARSRVCFDRAHLQLETVHISRPSSSVDGLNFRCIEANLLRSTDDALIQRTLLNVGNGLFDGREPFPPIQRLLYPTPTMRSYECLVRALQRVSRPPDVANGSHMPQTLQVQKGRNDQQSRWRPRQQPTRTNEYGCVQEHLPRSPQVR
jgi:hypothetical protein